MIKASELRIGNTVFYTELPGNFKNAKRGAVDIINKYSENIGIEGADTYAYANIVPNN